MAEVTLVVDYDEERTSPEEIIDFLRSQEGIDSVTLIAREVK